jgi:hypothetical protein
MPDNPVAVALKAEWKSICAERDELLRVTNLLHGTRDGAVLREHSARLARHHKRVQDFEKSLEVYHAEHGPLGNLAE